MRLVLIGPPGVGKGTQSVRLIAHLRVPHISTGEMLREAIRLRTRAGLLSEEYIQRGELVPDPIVLEMVGARLGEPDCAAGYLLDGFPRTVGQAVSLDAMLSERGTPLDGVLEMHAAREELVRRLTSRGRDDDQPAVVRQRLADYDQKTAPLLDYYHGQQLLYTIDGVGTPDEVFERICRALDRMRGGRAPSPAA